MYICVVPGHIPVPQWNVSIRLTTERHLFLFEMLLLITKKKEDHFVYKQHINISTSIQHSVSSAVVGA